MTNSPGSLSARPWSCTSRPVWRQTAASSIGNTSSGATATAPVRAVRAAPTSSRPGIWPNRSSRPRSRAASQPAGAEDRNAVPLYDFPNQKIIRHLVKEMPLRTSALRTLGAYGNVFALESFMDEAAAAAGADPVAFRLRHLKDPRGRAVIETAAAKAGWKTGFKSDGTHGRGFGFAKYKNLSCYVACVADVVSRSQDRARRCHPRGRRRRRRPDHQSEGS